MKIVLLFIKYYFFIQTPAVNCYGTLEFRYSLNGGDAQSTSDTSVTFYIDNNQSYAFSIRAKNIAGLTSTTKTISGTSPQLGKYEMF